ncbi:exosome complex component RRP41 isoform X3 [Octodon degus]|uniref:Exosome complex component RRP41 n=1 Tax=Octodon degus TaxID=10160 RepID=A0A6P6F5J7_OCTDE|nr:exosome complex component RRP41 isoform X3 [Octodon degus]XP_023579652.1 exosome complex component RRP41 isoform X3 [Octodon degus]
MSLPGHTKCRTEYIRPKTALLRKIRGSRSRALPDRALVNCQYSSATFSTGERKRRPHGDRKSCEMGLQLRQTFEAAILTQLHPRSQIDIYVQPLRGVVSLQVLQADGGTYAACVNAATLAVLDAGIPMRDFVCACSAGFVDGTALADLSHVEEAAGGPQLALALLPASGQIALLEMDARLHEDHLEWVLEAAAQAARDVHTLLDRVVRQHVHEASILLGD